MQTEKIPSQQPIPSQKIHQLFRALVEYHKAQGTSPKSDIMHLRTLITSRLIIRGSMLVSEMLQKMPVIRKVRAYAGLCDHIEALTGVLPVKLAATQLRQLYIYNKIDALMQDIEAPVTPDGTMQLDALEKKKTAAIKKLLGLLDQLI
jgi:hypothetical protein